MPSFYSYMYSINRNIVECKVIYHRRSCRRSSVLIETLWNVKRSRQDFPKSTSCINRNIVECKAISSLEISTVFLVLIETLWNVKDYYYCHYLCGQRSINRNIVECKDDRITVVPFFRLFVLIETLWNVKTLKK